MLSFDGHTPFENEAKLSTRVVVLRADRVRGSLDEPHDNFEFVRVGHFDSLQLGKTAASSCGLAGGNSSDTGGEEPE